MLSFYLFLPVFYFSANITTHADSLDPLITNITPSSAVSNSSTFSIKITGENFLPDAKVYFYNSEKTFAYVSSKEILVSIEESDIFIPGLYNIIIINADGKKSNTKVFTARSPIPTITKIAPYSYVLSENGLNLSIYGTNFIPGSIIYLNGIPKNTFYISENQLTSNIPTSDIILSGNYTITVANPDPGKSISNKISLTVNNPIPIINTISPDAASQGNGKITLTVQGSHFIPPISEFTNSGSVIYFNNSKLETIYNSPDQLTAYIPESLLNAASSTSIRAYNPPTGGGFSNSKSFSVKNPIPVISSISSSSSDVLSSGFYLTVIGSKFMPGATIDFNGIAQKTDYLSSTKIRAFITQFNLIKAGSYPITVSNLTPGGGKSIAKIFTVNNKVPILSGISKKSVLLGSGDLNLSVTGSNFVSDSVVNFDGFPIATNYVSTNTLSAFIPASYIANTGFYNITATSPAPGGGNSNPITFSVVNPVPTITSLSVESIIAGSSSFLLTVSGDNFTKDTIIQFNDIPAISNYYQVVGQKGQSTVLINASSIQNSGSYSITAINPSPGGGVSNKKLFTVLNRGQIYTYSSCYMNQCRIFSSPIQLSNTCKIETDCGLQ